MEMKENIINEETEAMETKENKEAEEILETKADKEAEKVAEANVALENGEAKKKPEKMRQNTKEEEEASRQERAMDVVKKFTAAAGVTGAIPIPMADAPILIGEQVAMLTMINSIYEIDASKHAVSSIVLGAFGLTGTTMVGRSLVRLVPGVGFFWGEALCAATAGRLTYALGRAYVVVCEEVKKNRLQYDDAKRELFRMLNEELRKGTKKSGVA